MKEKFEIIYRLFFIIVCGICVGIHFNLNDEYYNSHSFSFFTVQSNIFCLVIMCILLIKHLWGRDMTSQTLVFFSGMALSAIISTFLIYTGGKLSVTPFLLATKRFSLPYTSLFSHYLVPLMFTLDWFLFQPKGLFKKRYLIGWLIFPLFYFVCFLSRCHCNPASTFENVKKYPYFFLNYEKLGIQKFLKYIVLMLIIFFIVNLLIYELDKLVSKCRKRGV